jgi:hypothetical protein
MKRTAKKISCLFIALLLVLMQTIVISAETKSVKGMEITKLPTKVEYTYGKDTAPDLSGMEMTVTFDDETTAEWKYDVDGLKIGDQSILVSNKNAPENGGFFAEGSNTIVLSAGEVTAEFNVAVIPSNIKSIELVKAPTRTDYYAGTDVEISREGMQLKINYVDSSYKIYDFDKEKSNFFEGEYVAVHTENFENQSSVDGSVSYDISSIQSGDNKVTVSYMGAAATFTVKGIDTNVEAIKITKAPSKTDYVLGVDKNIVLEGLEVTVTYTDKTEKVYKYNDSFDTAFEGYDFEIKHSEFTVGTNTITVSYLDRTADFEVKFSESNVEKINIKAKPSKTEYIAYFDTARNLDLTGMQVEIIYKDGTSAVWSYNLDGNYYNGYMMNVYMAENEIAYGENTVVVKYLDKTAEFSVKGIKGSVQSPEPEPEKISLSGCVVTGISSKGYTGKEITLPINVTLKGVKLTAGTDFTVSYAGNKNIGNAIVRITGAGNYTGTILDTFIIRPKKVYGPSVKSSTKHRAKVSWKKVTGASGYIIRYSNKSNMKSYKEKTIKGGSKTSATIYSLTSGKRVYVKIRAYKNKGYSTFRGYFSARKSVKVK